MNDKYIDCFARMSKTKCVAVNEMLCEKGGCPFYKSVEEHKKSMENAKERIKTMIEKRYTVGRGF